MTEPTLSGRAVAVGLVLVATASLGFASRFAHDPLMGDEIYFVIAADHISHGRRPITRARADIARFASADLASGSPADERDIDYALWHPPLYLHLMALVFDLAGTGPAQARLIGLGCLLATVFAIYGLSQEVFRDRADRRAIGLLAAFLFAVNPLAIQGALVVDIDNTLLTPALLLTLLAIVRSLDGSRASRDLALGGLFAGLLWVKLTTPPVLVLALAIFLAAREGAGVALRRAGVIAAVGGAGFLGTWSAYARAQGVPAAAPFGHLVGSVVGLGPHGSFPTVALEAALALARLALWASPFLVLLWGMSLARRASEFASARAVRSEDLLHLTAALVLVTYLIVGKTTFSFPRYDYPVLPRSRSGSSPARGSVTWFPASRCRLPSFW
jgi:4-amino-4-deoxy-L-arabinose transferase-like glycosyltransferase